MDDTENNLETAALNVGDRLEVEIADMAFGGDGVGKVDGFVIFVPFAIVGELVLVEIFDAGVDIMTCGDHLWDQREVIELLDSEPRFVRPANYPPGTPGQGSTLFEHAGLPTVGIINAQGRTFMRGEMENPFRVVAEEVKKLAPLAPVIFLDFHAEATSEKIAMGRMLDGDVSAVVGTHTHVQTADEIIFHGGTAFLCDAGFTGPHDSVIGRDWEPVVTRFLTSQPQRFPVSKGRILLQGVMIEVDGATGKATSIERVSEAL